MGARARFNPFRVGGLVGWDGPRVVSLGRNNPGLDDGTPLAFTACASRRAIPQRSHGTIPTGLNQPAQGCEERATLGIAPTTRINPERVESSDGEHPAAAIRSAVRSTLSGLAVWSGGMDPG